MIASFVKVWDEFKGEVEAKLRPEHPSYEKLVKYVIEMLHDHIDEYGEQPDPTRITKIDHGDYQGTLLFIIAAEGYQPDTYWSCKVGYGSCSGCDTLQSISDYSDDAPNDEQVKDYMTLALHIVQGLHLLA
jgi:hypothetical protein